MKQGVQIAVVVKIFRMCIHPFLENVQYPQLDDPDGLWTLLDRRRTPFTAPAKTQETPALLLILFLFLPRLFIFLLAIPSLYTRSSSDIAVLCTSINRAGQCHISYNQ